MHFCRSWISDLRGAWVLITSLFWWGRNWSSEKLWDLLEGHRAVAKLCYLYFMLLPEQTADKNAPPSNFCYSKCWGEARMPASGEGCRIIEEHMTAGCAGDLLPVRAMWGSSWNWPQSVTGFFSGYWKGVSAVTLVIVTGWYFEQILFLIFHIFVSGKVKLGTLFVISRGR